MAAPPVRRNPPRKRRVRFRFETRSGETFETTARDASIRAARFDLSDQNRVAGCLSATALFDSIDLRLEQMALPPKFVREDQGDFVAIYSTRQLEQDGELEGRYAIYTIVEFIGAGQSAETYKARVKSVRRRGHGLGDDQAVVIKIPLFIPYLSDHQNEELILSIDLLLTREETSLRRLADLDCVARFLDIGIHEFPLRSVPSTKFMVQQLVDGQPLDEYLSQNYGNPFSGLRSDDFYRVGRAIAEAIRKVHSKLVIHGDIWPENIMVRGDGSPVLIDFGQAILREVVGTVVQVSGRNARYVAPERTPSVAGDVYSLGGVLHYLATGSDPPQRLPEDIDALKFEIVQTTRRTNDWLYRENRGAADVIARCLRMSDQRTAHAQGVVEDLDTFFARPSRTEVCQAVAIVGSEAAGLDAAGPELFRWIASLRLNALRATLSDMTSGVFDLVGDHETIVSALSQYIGLLGEKDKYLTLSIPKFWSPGNLGVNGRFMSMNTIAAQRGAILKRLFLMTPRDQSDPLFRQIMNAQSQVLRDIREEKLTGGYEVRTLDVDETEGSDILKKGHHFGLLVKQGNPVAIFPVYRGDGSLAAVRFRAGENLVGDLEQVFDIYWERGTPLVPPPEQ